MGRVEDGGGAGLADLGVRRLFELGSKQVQLLVPGEMSILLFGCIAALGIFLVQDSMYFFVTKRYV